MSICLSMIGIQSQRYIYTYTCLYLFSRHFSLYAAAKPIDCILKIYFTILHKEIWRSFSLIILSFVCFSNLYGKHKWPRCRVLKFYVKVKMELEEVPFSHLNKRIMKIQNHISFIKYSLIIHNTSHYQSYPILTYFIRRYINRIQFYRGLMYLYIRMYILFIFYVTT